MEIQYQVEEILACCVESQYCW